MTDTQQIASQSASSSSSNMAWYGANITEVTAQTYNRLSQVQGAMKRIEKRGYNESQKYKFVTESDAVDEVRGELAKVKLALTFDTILCEVTPYKESGGKAKICLQAWVRDGNNGVVLDFGKWFGVAHDYGDKYVTKATTSAKKYCYLVGFGLSTGEDLENANKAGDGQPAKGKKPVDDTMSTMAITLLWEQAGKPDGSLSKYISNRLLPDFASRSPRTLTDEEKPPVVILLQAQRDELVKDNPMRTDQRAQLTRWRRRLGWSDLEYKKQLERHTHFNSGSKITAHEAATLLLAIAKDAEVAGISLEVSDEKTKPKPESETLFDGGAPPEPAA